MITSGNKVGAVRNVNLKNLLEKDTVVNCSAYCLAPNEKLLIQEIMKDFIANGIIRPSKNPFASSILIVKRKYGSFRMCVNFRKPNHNTIKDRFPLLSIDDLVYKLGEGHNVTSLDVVSGFYQIPNHKDSIHNTAFVIPYGHFESIRMSWTCKCSFKDPLISLLEN